MSSLDLLTREEKEEEREGEKKKRAARFGIGGWWLVVGGWWLDALESGGERGDGRDGGGRMEVWEGRREWGGWRGCWMGVEMMGDDGR